MRWRPRPRSAGARSARRPGADLHARQGPRAVRARHARRADGPPRAHDRATKRASSRSSACRRRRFPTTSRWSATRPTAIPGLPGWGAKSAAAVLARYGHLEEIPADWRTWGVNAASPARWRATLARERDARSCSARWRRCAPTSRCSRRGRSAVEGSDAGVRAARRDGSTPAVTEPGKGHPRRRSPSSPPRA